MNPETKEEKVLEDRKKKIFDSLKEKDFLKIFKKKETLFILISLAVLIFLAWHIRTANVPNLKDTTTNDYTLGPDLDPFLFLRYAKIIVENGSLPEIDMMRYVPLGYKTIGETKLLPYLIAYFHKSLNFLNPVSINYSAAMFPAFMFLLTVIAFFLLIRKVFEDNKSKNWIALISTIFLIVAPSLLPRTVAGIPEKESAGFLFLFLALYLFLKAWKTEKFTNALFVALLAGISTALMGLIWGGWIYIFITIALYGLVCFVLGKIEKKEFGVYAVWLITSFIIPITFTAKYHLSGLIKSTTSGLSLAILILMAIDLLIFKTKLKNIKIIENLNKKLPEKAVSLIIFVVLILIILLANSVLNLSFLPKLNFITSTLFHLKQPYVDRVSFTVAENKQPYFSEWVGNFGPEMFGEPILFWLFFIGSIFLFYETIKDIHKKEKIILMIVYIVFLICLIFSRYSPSSLFNGENNISNFVYFGSFVLLIITFCYLYYKYSKENKVEEFKKINFSYLLLFVYFIPSLIGARSAIRLIMALVPPVAGIAGFFFVYSIQKIKNKGDETMKILNIVVAVIVVISSCYAIYYNYKYTLASAKSMVPLSGYTQDWQRAMAWVRENTPNDAVFAHWWDYGYWLQSIGERATVLDGGNSIPYWNYLMGRYALTGQNEAEALEFLYTHKATHFLIDSSEIGKYPAYSSIGSDENYDRYSWIGTFLMNDQATEEKKNETVYVYYGGSALDEDYVYKTESQEIFFPAERTGIGAVMLTVSSDGSKFKQPEAIFVYQNKQYRVPMRYMYFNGKTYDFEKGYKGTFYVFPSVVQQNGGYGINPLGASMFLSERNMRALWVKLYLFDDAKNFELIHSEQNLIVQDFRKNGATIGDFLYYQGIQGPIKIWKIKYTGQEKENPEYLLRTYPEKLGGVILAKK